MDRGCKKSLDGDRGRRTGPANRRRGIEFKTDIADVVARILRPLVGQKLAEEALAKLAQEIDKLLSSEDAIHLKISGPADLVFELRKNIPPNAIVTVLTGDKPEVTVIANKTVIETRLGEWLARVGVVSNGPEREP